MEKNWNKVAIVVAIVLAIAMAIGIYFLISGIEKPTSPIVESEPSTEQVLVENNIEVETQTEVQTEVGNLLPDISRVQSFDEGGIKKRETYMSSQKVETDISTQINQIRTDTTNGFIVSDTEHFNKWGDGSTGNMKYVCQLTEANATFAEYTAGKTIQELREGFFSSHYLDRYVKEEHEPFPLGLEYIKDVGLKDPEAYYAQNERYYFYKEQLEKEKETEQEETQEVEETSEVVEISEISETSETAETQEVEEPEETEVVEEVDTRPSELEGYITDYTVSCGYQVIDDTVIDTKFGPALYCALWSSPQESYVSLCTISGDDGRVFTVSVRDYDTDNYLYAYTMEIIDSITVVK